MKIRKYRYDYYTVSLPSDLFPDTEDGDNQMINHAIDCAREQSRLYAIPCEWRAKIISTGHDVTYRVCRKRLNRNPS